MGSPSLAGDTLLSSETFTGAKGVATSLEGSFALLGQRERWASVELPGYLAGTDTAGGKRQVMFTLQRLELPQGFNQFFESAPGSEPQITTRAAYLISRSQVPSTLPSLQLCLLSPSWKGILSPSGYWKPDCIPMGSLGPSLLSPSLPPATPSLCP